LRCRDSLHAYLNFRLIATMTEMLRPKRKWEGETGLIEKAMLSRYLSDLRAVFCVGEKTAIQALDRLDPVLPLSPGRTEKHGFEYYRHGTLSLSTR
jgi:hypothetical protein